MPNFPLNMIENLFKIVHIMSTHCVFLMHGQHRGFDRGESPSFLLLICLLLVEFRGIQKASFFLGQRGLPLNSAQEGKKDKFTGMTLNKT